MTGVAKIESVAIASAVSGRAVDEEKCRRVRVDVSEHSKRVDDPNKFTGPPGYSLLCSAGHHVSLIHEVARKDPLETPKMD